MITVSIVSHGHCRMVDALLDDLLACPEVTRVVLTINVPETEAVVPAPLAGRIVVLRNAAPKGFAANHNAAFAHCATPFYCVLNPDVRFDGNPFPVLLDCLSERVALCAPAVLSPAAGIEDSARRFPGLLSLFAKLLGLADGRYHYDRTSLPFHPDWVAGMFMLFAATDYAALGGFDTAYFLYYEDVDICVRLWRAGRQIVLCPQAGVVHAAQRASRHKLRHQAWHLQSMARYFIRYWGRLPAGGGRR